MDKGFERIELLRKIGALATKLNETIRTLRENDDAVSVTSVAIQTNLESDLGPELDAASDADSVASVADSVDSYQTAPDKFDYLDVSEIQGLQQQVNALTAEVNRLSGDIQAAGQNVSTSLNGMNTVLSNVGASQARVLKKLLG